MSSYSLQRREPVGGPRCADALQIRVHHHLDEAGEVHDGLPSKLTARFRAVADEMLHFGWSDELGIEPDVLEPVEAGVTESDLHEVADRMADAGRDHVVVRSLLLEHEPHRDDVVAGKAPVAMGLEISERQRVRKAH